MKAACAAELFLPFLFAALCIGLTFTQHPDQIGRLSCYNLIGSGVIGLSLLYLLMLPEMFTWCLGWPDSLRIFLTLLIVAPLGFCMGIPFPFGMDQLSHQAAHLLPWAYGINGCASVLSSLLATALAMVFGFRMVILTGVGFYALAAGLTVLFLRKPCPSTNSCFYSEIS